jgi:hypothetical protein
VLVDGLGGDTCMAVVGVLRLGKEFESCWPDAA